MTLLRLFCMSVLACSLAGTAAAAPSGTARATVHLRARTVMFRGGRCLKAVRGFRVRIGRLTGPRYFDLLYILTRKRGTYRNGGTISVGINGKYYIAQQGTLKLTIGNNARKGTFSGRFRSGGGSFKGSFAC